MPMPPPRPGPGHRDLLVRTEMGQIERALRANGPLLPDELATALGAAYWEPGRYDRALACAVADGLVEHAPDERLRLVPEA